MTASLSVTYDALFTAQVLRELCLLGKPKEALTPALRQWRILIDLYAGILTSVDFIHVLSGFHRLALPYIGNSSKLANGTTAASNLAIAILALGRVSKEDIHSVTILGGMDCVWLAAFADWILLLDVGLLDPTSSPLYRSRKGVCGAPQVIFRLCEERDFPMNRDLLASRRTLIQNGQTLFCHIDEEQKRSSRFRATWETILRDTFPDAIDLLTQEKTNHGLARYLYCVSSLEKFEISRSRFVI